MQQSKTRRISVRCTKNMMNDIIELQNYYNENTISDTIRRIVNEKTSKIYGE